MMHQQRRAVGAEAEIGGVAEGDHAAAAHDELQADGEQREDEDLAQDLKRVVAGDQRQDREDRHHRRDRPADRARPPAGART